MFEHYLPNKNERATVAPKSKFTQLNKGIVIEGVIGDLVKLLDLLLKGYSLCPFICHFSFVAGTTEILWTWTFVEFTYMTHAVNANIQMHCHNDSYSEIEGALKPGLIRFFFFIRNSIFFS